jgi:predicted ester cyclase
MTTTTTTPTNRSSSAAFAVMRRIFGEGFATGDASVVDEVCSPDLVEHQFGTAGPGSDAIAHVKAAIRDVHGAVPDISFTIEDSVEDGDIIWVRVRAQGTATGPFFGPPSGRHLDFTVIDVAHIVDGRIAEHWGARPVRHAGPDRGPRPARMTTDDHSSPGRPLTNDCQRPPGAR